MESSCTKRRQQAWEHSTSGCQICPPWLQERIQSYRYAFIPWLARDALQNQHLLSQCEMLYIVHQKHVNITAHTYIFTALLKICRVHSPHALCMLSTQFDLVLPPVKPWTAIPLFDESLFLLQHLFLATFFQPIPNIIEAVYSTNGFVYTLRDFHPTLAIIGSHV